MTDFFSELPKLRLVDASPLQYEGADYLLLRDPLQLTEETLLVPQPIIPLLALCDGSRSPAALRAALAVRYGLILTPQRISEFLNRLDDALVLDNQRARSARAQAAATFRQQPFRPPASAGAAYPAEPSELAAYLQNFQNAHNGAPPARAEEVLGLVSPHIDFDRGGPVYAQVWGRAAAAARAADLAIIFGTDHFSEGFRFSLTRQHYATPFGVLPTDTAIVDALAGALGEETAFAGELHHMREHSIELAAVWLHHIRGKRPVHLVPILTGSLDGSGCAEEVEMVLTVLQDAMRGRKVIVIAAGDLAHVGPAFSTDPVDASRLAALRAADEALVDAMQRADPERFLDQIERVENQNNVCGVSPIYLTLRLVSPERGEPHGYAVCPADTNNTSVVTICGVTLHAQPDQKSRTV
jgi:AmmeMemoRadiSam system protein B